MHGTTPLLPWPINPPDKTPLGNSPLFAAYVGRLRLGPRLVGRIGSGVQVSTSFQKKSAGFRLPQQKLKGGYDLGFSEGFSSYPSPQLHDRNNTTPPEARARKNNKFLFYLVRWWSSGSSSAQSRIKLWFSASCQHSSVVTDFETKHRRESNPQLTHRN